MIRWLNDVKDYREQFKNYTNHEPRNNRRPWMANWPAANFMS